MIWCSAASTAFTAKAEQSSSGEKHVATAAPSVTVATAKAGVSVANESEKAEKNAKSVIPRSALAYGEALFSGQRQQSAGVAG